MFLTTSLVMLLIRVTHVSEHVEMLQKLSKLKSASEI